MSKVVLDTNVLLENRDIIDEHEEVILNTSILEELDGLKKNDGEVGFKARKAIHKIENSNNIKYVIKDKYDVPSGWDENKRDNHIVCLAKEHNATLISNDINVLVKARSLDINCEKSIKTVGDNYTGFKEFEMDAYELAEWYSNPSEKIDKWGLHTNEYLFIKEDGKIVDTWVNSKKGFRMLEYPKRIESVMLGKFSSKDVYQNCILDSFYNNKMTMVKGKAGTGKSLLALSYSMSQIEKGKYDKLIILCNTVATKNSAKLGYYPGSRNDKLLDSQIGNMLVSKLGDRCIVEDLIRRGVLILLPFSDIRGYDTTGMNAICWIVEAQNLDIELMKLAIQRIGDDSQLIIDGDYNAQVDCGAYEGNNNGMRRVSEVFRGESFYGEVELQTVYRSKMAEIADKL